MKKIRKLLLSPLTSLLTMALCICVFVDKPAFVESVKYRYLDTVITSKPVTQSKDVVIVNIDDETLKQKGQFPFPRGEYAKIIRDLYQRGAGLVVFNVYMPDNDRFFQDDALANTFRKYPVILPQAGSNDKQGSVIPFRPGVSVIGEGFAGVDYNSIQPNVKALNETAAGIGIVNTFPELDGVTRRVPMVVQSQGLLLSLIHI